MTMRLSVESVLGQTVQPTTFGGNFLFNRDELGDGSGDFNALAAELGVESLRYPGGAITEFMFDLENPDSTVGYNIKGEEQELVGLSDFLDFAQAEGKSVTIVLPTRNFLSDATDLNGNRFARFDDEIIQNFVTDVVRGEYGDVQIDAFEIGNEYWGSGGMTSVEYGRLSSRMAAVIDETLDTLKGETVWLEDTDVVVQAGTNYNFSKLDDRYVDIEDGQDTITQLEKDYGLELSDNALRGNGTVNWTAVNNELLLDKFDRPEEIEAVDAVVNHLYTRDHDAREDPEFALNTIEQYWEPHFDGIKSYITEYNQKANTANFGEDDYGLKNAHELLNIVEELTDHGVDQAHVWPLSQLTENALSRGFAFENLSPTGEMFKMMNEELPGLRAIQFDGAQGRETEASSANGSLNVHAFAEPDKMVLYFASNADENISYDVDLSGLIMGAEDIDVTVLGVEDGDVPGNKNAAATVQERDSDKVVDDGVVQADLKPHEIMQIVIDKPVWTPEMEQALAAPVDDDSMPLPMVDPDNTPLEPEEASEGEEDDTDVFEGMDFVLMLLPLLALAGLG
ncbi:hypothetical protein [Pseudosulfitobacter sp. SM2401]|uniref:hypothetical protein n=1 Tax=Pseudosulfitobacter sp. SM2401 TaxID=3350098 RepID=UPI0036F3F184